MSGEEFFSYVQESFRVLTPGGLFIIFDCFDDASAGIAARAEKKLGFERLFFKGTDSPLLAFKKPEQKY
jgi:hypothetical protein